MPSKLYYYCGWNWPQDVKTYLEENPDTWVIEDEGCYIRRAISNESPAMFEALLEHFRKTLPEDTKSPDFIAPVKQLSDIIEEYYGFTDLMPEMKMTLLRLFPSIVERGLVYAAGEGRVDVIKELYPYFQAKNKGLLSDLLEAAVDSEQDAVIELLAEMESSMSGNRAKKKAMVLRKAADLYSNYDNYKKTALFYEKAIAACDDYLTSNLHYANYLQRKFCTDITFDPAMAAKAEAHYKTVTEHSPTYSYAHKKLGILYQIWSEHDKTNATTLAKQAINCYIAKVF